MDWIYRKKSQVPAQPDPAEMARRWEIVYEDKAALSFSRRIGLLPAESHAAKKEFDTKYKTGTVTDEDYAKYELAMRIANDAAQRHSTILETGYMPERYVNDEPVSAWRKKLYNAPHA